MKTQKETAVFCFKINDGQECEFPEFTVSNNGKMEIIFDDKGGDGETYGHIILNDGCGNECKMFMKRI